MPDINTSQNKIRPSIVAETIRSMRGTGISLYVHGAPGISKSAVARQEADKLNIAFIDFRLSGVAPEDIRGVPFVGDAGGMKGLIWTPPLIFPRDLDLMDVADVTGSKVVRFYNPVGNNGIHYCRNPTITVTALNDDQTAHVIEQRNDRFVIVLKDTENNAASGQVIWTVTGETEAIFALEEFNSAPPSVMAAAYQLILDRRVGDYIVPDGVMLIAMGNRDGDKGVTFKIPKPVANRFVHIEMEINHEDWQTWAITHDMHADVVGYLAKWTAQLFDDKFAENPAHNFATPRSWEFVSKIISQTEKRTPTATKALICGAIGDVIGTAFLMHREYMEDMPDVKDIFSGRITEFLVKNERFKIQIAYSTSVQMCYELKKESEIIDRKYNGRRLEIESSPERQKWNERADRALGYAMNNFTPEVLIVFQRMALVVYRLRFNSSGIKNFKAFTKEYRDLVL